MSAFRAPPGTRDLLVPESTRLAGLVTDFARTVQLAGYGLVLGPMLEDAAVFTSGVGEATDIVAKEMYELEDRGGRRLALRPEGTASIVRAFVQHRPPTPFKAWYVTPAFRYERPQAGRYRQHHQVGVEALGTDDPDLDVELVGLLMSYLEGTGLQSLELKVSSMGDETCRPGYVAALGAYLSTRENELCSEHQARWRLNPLRFLDCKKPECVKVRAGAPRLSDALCGPCRAHLERVLEGLDSQKIPWRRDDALVRGLDYYTRTTFEVASLALDAAQDALGGGGRYDRLAERLGGPATPGIGFASGLERVLGALRAEGVPDPTRSPVEVFVVDVAGGASARDLTAELRKEGIGAERSFDQRSMKAQLRQADRSGARLALIVGQKELSAGEVGLKWLRDSGNDGDSSGGGGNGGDSSGGSGNGGDSSGGSIARSPRPASTGADAGDGIARAGGVCEPNAADGPNAADRPGAADGLRATKEPGDAGGVAAFRGLPVRLGRDGIAARVKGLLG